MSNSDCSNDAIGTATLGGGGGGYAVNDTGTVTTGGGNATYQVLTTGAGGAVATFEITSGGSGYVVATGLATAIGGAQPGVGAGFTVNVTAIVADSNVCMVPSCSSGYCFWGNRNCDDGDPNTLDSCDPKIGCVHIPNLACPDYLNISTDTSNGPIITFTDVTGAQITLHPTESTNVCSSVPNVPAGIMVTSCGNSVDACDELQNASTAAVTATDLGGNQFPIQPGGSAVICNTVPLVPAGVTLGCNGCCTYTNTTKAAAPIQFSDADGNSYLLGGGQEALVCDSVPTIPTGISQSCPPPP